MSSDSSDIELQTVLPTKPKTKAPPSPSDGLLTKKPKKNLNENEDSNKKSTKMMIHEALIELKTRKGVSLYAIKKYLIEKYSVDIEKINYIIKKYIKKAVEEGTIVQVKGIGASGSFKLVPDAEKKKKVKPKKINEGEPKKIKEGTEKSKPSIKIKTTKKTSKEKLEKEGKKKDSKSKSEDKLPKLKKNPSKEKVIKTLKAKVIDEDGDKIKNSKNTQAPAKKKSAMMKKRKSIGTIIKPPKMKPK